MPGFDRTGPWGYGPATGRGLGPCRMGRGMPRGFGRGRGFGPAYAQGYGYGYQPTREQEIADLRAEREALEQELGDIKSRIGELEKQKG